MIFIYCDQPCTNMKCIMPLFATPASSSRIPSPTPAPAPVPAPPATSAPATAAPLPSLAPCRLCVFRSRWQNGTAESL